jgi:hypothetical protein
MTTRTVRRYDAPGKIRVVRTAEGFLLTTGKIAKPGVMLYRKADGTTTRELVEPETLQDEVSNASLFAKALVIEHPVADVGPDNWAELSHGTSGPGHYDEAHEDGPGLYAPLAVHTRAILDELDDPNGRRELSPGYSVEVDDTPGTHPEYGDYDTRQLPGTRRYNHVALTESARGGSDLQIRKDSAHEVAPMAAKNTPVKPDPKTRKDSEPDELPEPEDKMDAFMSKMDAFMSKMDERISALEGAKKDAEPPADPPVPAQPTPEDKADSRLNWFKARKELESLAERFQVKTDSLDDNALKAAIVKAHNPSSTRTDSAYLDAALEFIKASGSGSSANPYRNAGMGLLDYRADANPPPSERPSDPYDPFFKGVQGRK